MLAVFARAGWPLQRRVDSGVIEVDFPDRRDARVRRFDESTRAARRLPGDRPHAAASGDRRGRSFGPSRIGRRRRLAQRHCGGERARLRRQPHPHAHSATTPVYATASPTSPTIISLAVDRRPAEALEATIDDCIAAHVRGAIVVTSVDGANLDLDAIVVRARNNGMRIIGPSSMGVAAVPTADRPRRVAAPGSASTGGGVAISMQSGSLGASFLGLAKQQALGLSWFVSLGDRADVSGTDLLQFFEDDESTRVDRHVHRGPRRPAALRPHRPARIATPPDRRRAHERRARARRTVRCTATAASSKCRPSPPCSTR